MPSLRSVGCAVVALGVVALTTVSTASASTATFGASPTAVGSATPVTATFGLPAAGATAGTAQEITQAFDPTYLRLDGASQVTAPDGWATTFSTDGTSFGAAPTTAAGWAAVRAVRSTGSVTATAATGGSATASVATPASAPFTAAGGGDGWNVVFDNDNHVFNVWHHNGSNGIGAIDCHTRTGASCGPGWPFYMSATGAAGNSGARVLNTGVRSDGWVDEGRKRFWFATNDNTNSTGVACVDISNFTTGPTWCGGSATAAFVVLGSAGPAGYTSSGGNDLCNTTVALNCTDGLAVAGSRIYTLETRTGKLLCADVSANNGAGAACAGQPYTFPGANAAPTLWAASTSVSGWNAVLFNLNGNIIGTGIGSYSSTANPVAFCAVGSTGAACPGWSTPKALPASTWFSYAEPSAAGTINGVCFRHVAPTSAGSPTCFSEAGASITGNSAIGSTFRWADGSDNAASTAITIGSRVLWGAGDWNNTSPLYCVDAATDANCANWPVSGVDNYVMVIDPLNNNCFWTNGHAGQIKQIDVNGQLGCTTVPGRASFSPTQLVTTQRVSCTNEPAWATLSISSPARGTYSSPTLTVLNAEGQVVVSGGRTWQNVPINADGTIELTGLSQAATGSAPQFVVNMTGRTNDDSITTTITTPARAPELCAALTPQVIACPSPKAPAGSLLGWTSRITATGSQGSSKFAPAAVPVRFSNASTAKCTPTARITVKPSKRMVAPGSRFRIAVRTCSASLAPLTGTNTSVRVPRGLVVVGRGGATITTVARQRVATWKLGTLAPGKCVTRNLTVRATTLGLKRVPGTTTSTDAATARASGTVRVGVLPVVG